MGSPLPVTEKSLVDTSPENKRKLAGKRPPTAAFSRMLGEIPAVDDVIPQKQIRKDEGFDTALHCV